MKSLSERLAPLRSELRTNARLRTGIGVITALALWWLWLVIGDWRDFTLREAGRAHEQIVRMQALSSDEEWIQRASQSEEMKAALEAEISPVNSPGLGQAAFQTALTRALENLDIQPRLSMEPPLVLDRPTGIIRVSATLNGSASPQQVIELLRRIESERQLMVVPLLQIRSEANETFQMTVHAYYRLSTGASE